MRQAQWINGVSAKGEMESQEPVTPMTALIIDAQGRLTYTGQDGKRYVIIGNQELLDQLRDNTDDPNQ